MTIRSVQDLGGSSVQLPPSAGGRDDAALFLAAFDHLEAAAAFRRGDDRINRLRGQRRVYQVADAPYAIRDALRERWRGPQARGGRQADRA